MSSDPQVLHNRHGLRITVDPLGASWTSCLLPLDSGPREILLGSQDLAATLAGDSYLGASIGRYAGRIAHARYAGHLLAANQPPHCLHGGPDGFSRRRWQLHPDRCTPQQLTLSLHSPAGDQGFPGNLDVEACFQLGDDNSLTIGYTAHCDAPTPCNLSNHAYFNLNGGNHDNGLDQVLRINARRYQPVAADGIPDRPPRDVAGTGFDFRSAKLLRRDYLCDDEQQQLGGYDHSFLLDNQGRLALAAELCSSDGLVRMQLLSDQPALHLYTGQYLGGTTRRDGGFYAANAGIALESQYPPDSPSHGQAILLPGTNYHHTIRLLFEWPGSRTKP